jgi:hypothetical protein
LGDRIRYVGLDVHKEGIVVAVAEGGPRREVRDYGRIANTPAALRRLAHQLGQEKWRGIYLLENHQICLTGKLMLAAIHTFTENSAERRANNEPRLPQQSR